MSGNIVVGEMTVLAGDDDEAYVRLGDIVVVKITCIYLDSEFCLLF